MDANGLRFWMLSRKEDWPLPAQTPGLYYCSKSNRLQLLSMNNDQLPAEDFPTASKLVESVPMARDQFGNYARWDVTSGHVLAGGSGPGEVPIYAPPTSTVTDLVLGYDGILYIAVAGTLVMVDRRNRWPNVTLADSDFNFWRLAALPAGGVLALDRNEPQLAKVTGQPLQVGPADVPSPGIMRSCQQNPDPPHIEARYALPSSETFVALAPMDQEQFVLLSWQVNSAANQNAYLRTFSETGGLGAPLQLGPNPYLTDAVGVRWPYSVAWIGDTRVAILAESSKEALVFDTQNVGGTLVPAGETYILADANLGPFVHGFDLPPYYANGSEMLPLLPLSLNSFAVAGTTDPAVFDSGSSQTVWHRMFVEAVIPPRCGALIFLAVAGSQADLASSTTTWYPHVLGTPDTSSIAVQFQSDVPRAVWQPASSEVPFAPSLLNEDSIQDRQGLFMVLIQRAGTVVRNLRGRYLGVRVQLNGDRRNTPELAALRVYASRFSYVERYLPEIYHECKFGDDADKLGTSTRQDFFERFVDLFESQLTRIEDKVGNAYLLMRPESSPDDSLDWLGGWVGIPPGDYPPDRRRTRLEKISKLYRTRGTTGKIKTKKKDGSTHAVGGVTQAIDIATNGMCSRGAVVVIEDFRLRHIFATILGADLSIKDDPLLPGYSGSSNSIVGDTLFLGDPSVQAELQALFAKDLNIPGGEQAAEALYDNLANRVTVFIHDQVEKVDVMLVQRIVEQEKPAHVLASVQTASQPFMIGLASLLGINTYLGPEPPRGTATLDLSQVGRYDVVTHLPSLDPRLENGELNEESGTPVARLSGTGNIMEGTTITLDGSASTAPPGRTITSYQWSMVQP